MQSEHWYAERAFDVCKNRDMEATFMQTSPLSASTTSVHLYSGRAMTPANTKSTLAAWLASRQCTDSPKIAGA